MSINRTSEIVKSINKGFLDMGSAFSRGDKKMKTIKDAVIELSGKLPPEPHPDSKLSDYGGTYYIYEDDVRVKLINGSIAYNEKVCSVAEYKAEAKRLGYINGYRWGSEYPTNGKRPELPDGVLVHGRYDFLQNEWGEDNQVAGEAAWHHITAFRITDPRFKPADEVSEIAESINKAEYVSELRDNKPFDRKVSGFVKAAANKIMGDIMKNEPIGMSEQKTPDISDLIVALSEASNLAVDLGLTDCARDILEVCKSAKKDRKREKTVDAAMSLSADYYDAHTLFYAMYDAGMLVLPQDSSDTE